MSTAYSVPECLRGYTLDTLGVMCDRWNLVASSKPNRIRALEKVLTDPLHMGEAMRGLNSLELRMLNAVLNRGGCVVGDVLGVAGLFGKGQPKKSLQNLLELGLVLVSPENPAGAFSITQLGREDYLAVLTQPLIVPGAAFTKIPPAPPLEYMLASPVEFVQSGIEESTESATAAILETLRVVDVVGPRVTATGEVHKSDLAKAKEMAKEAGVSAEMLTFSLVMARELGCIATQGGRLGSTSLAARWSQESPAERTRSLFKAFVSTEEAPELGMFFPQISDALFEHLPKRSLRRTYHKALPASLMSLCMPDKWYRVDEFVDLIRRVDSNVLFLHERWRAIAAGSHSPTTQWTERGWQTHEQRMFTWMIQSLFHKLGVVALANDGAVFRLTSAGRYALDIGEAPTESAIAAGHALVIQPDFEIIAYMDLCPPDLRRRLDTYCERLRGGQVSTYRLTQDSVYRGLRAGTPMREFLRTLESNSLRGVPGNVSDQLGIWEQKIASIRVSKTCRLLECVSEQQASEWQAKLPGARRLGVRYLQLQDDVADELVRIDYNVPRPPALRQEPGLSLSVPWEDIDLFLRPQLGSFGSVSVADNGDLTISLEKLASHLDLDWTALASRLESLVDDSLAARYRAALRTWYGDSSPPSALTATVVRFDSPDACNAVLETPEVAQFVMGRLGLYTLVLKPKSLPAFKRALKVLGVSVSANGVRLDDGPPETWAWPEVPDSEVVEQPGPQAAPRRTKEKRDVDAQTLPAYSPRIIREIVEDAIHRRRPVLIQYQSSWSPSPSVRRVNPVSIDASGTTPSLSGYCHRHGGARVFKLARISGIRVLEDEKF